MKCRIESCTNEITNKVYNLCLSCYGKCKWYGTLPPMIPKEERLPRKQRGANSEVVKPNSEKYKNVALPHIELTPEDHRKIFGIEFDLWEDRVPTSVIHVKRVGGGYEVYRDNEIIAVENDNISITEVLEKHRKA